jgi:hypothetical protein
MGKMLTCLARLPLALNCEHFGQLQEAVRASETLKSSHRPDGKNANALASTLARTTAADTPVNYSMYVPQRPELFPSPPWEHC